MKETIIIILLDSIEMEINMLIALVFIATKFINIPLSLSVNGGLIHIGILCMRKMDMIILYCERSGFMDKNYHLADIKDKEVFLNQISKYEEELSTVVGNDMILIAYTKDVSGVAY